MVIQFHVESTQRAKSTKGVHCFSTMNGENDGRQSDKTLRYFEFHLKWAQTTLQCTKCSGCT